VLDGAGFIADNGPQTCPGAVPGQFGANVRKSGAGADRHERCRHFGLEIRNFCIGVLIT
jgi:3-dehydroshikimate dehydratase